jgi:hypothetical protein
VPESALVIMREALTGSYYINRLLGRRRVGRHWSY